MAINIPRESIANLERELSLIRSVLGEKGIRWTKPENIHFTLAFLGETPDEKLKIINYKLQMIAKEFKPFDIKLKGMGIFPHLSRPRILWIDGESRELQKLGETFQKELKKDGFRIDDHKPFQAHLTIGRIKFADQNFKEKLSEIIDQYKEKQFGQFDAKSIEIMESKLEPEGPKYKVISSHKFIAINNTNHSYS